MVLSPSHMSRKSNPSTVCNSYPSLVTTLPWIFPCGCCRGQASHPLHPKKDLPSLFFRSSTSAQLLQALCFLQHQAPAQPSFFQCRVSGLGSCSFWWLPVISSGWFPTALAPVTLQQVLRHRALLQIALWTRAHGFVACLRDRALRDYNHPVSKTVCNSA